MTVTYISESFEVFPLIQISNTPTPMKMRKFLTQALHCKYHVNGIFWQIAGEEKRWSIDNMKHIGPEYQFRGKPCIINDRKASFKDNRDKRTNDIRTKI